MKAYRPFISSFILLVAGLQLYAVVTETNAIWPFIDYPMYRDKHFEGDYLRISSRFIAMFEDGSEITLSRNDFENFTLWHFEYGLVNPVLAGRTGRRMEAAEKLMIDASMRRVGKAPVEVRIEQNPSVRITKNGPEYLDEPAVIATHKLR